MCVDCVFDDYFLYDYILFIVYVDVIMLRMFFYRIWKKIFINVNREYICIKM